MKKFKLIVTSILITFLFLLWSIAFAGEGETVDKEISQSVSYDFDLKGITLEQTIEDFGEPNIKLKVNSASSKTKMPPFLVDYFNSQKELVEVLICRWHEPNRSIEICYKNTNGIWHVLGRKVTTTEVKKP